MPIETIKFSEVPILAGADLVATDRVVVLDRSATTGTGSGPEGTIKMMEASRLGSFTTVKGVVHNLNLVGINTNQPLFKWVVSAINTYGPYPGNVGEDLYFRTYQVSQPYSITIMYFKLISGRLLAGGAGNTVLPDEIVLAGGPWVTNAEVNADLFLEIGDAGVGPIHTYFNLGEDHVVDGDPWVITGQQFLTGILDDEPTIWLFLGGDGNWGGDSGNNTNAGMFVNLSQQPPAIGFPLIKIHNLSLFGIDPTLPELSRVGAAVKARGPFTCLPKQQMAFKTSTTMSGTGSGGIGYVITQYYLLIPYYTSVGGPYPQPVPGAWFKPDGDSVINQVHSGNTIELGDIGTDNVWDVFNEGNSGVEWDMDVYLFVRATQDAEVRLWFFEGTERYYGGADMGTGYIYEAFEADFFLLNDQPVVPSPINKLFYEDIAAMIARQDEQTIQTDLEVEDASDDPNITFPNGETRKWATYRWLGTTDGDIDDYRLVSAPYGNHTGALKQVIQTGNFVLTVTDNDATISTDGGSCTINPNTQAYQDAYVVAMKNITDATDGSIVCTAATGWTYKVNDNATVASGTFVFPAGSTCTIIKFEGTNKIYIDGGVE